MTTSTPFASSSPVRHQPGAGPVTWQNAPHPRRRRALVLDSGALAGMQAAQAVVQRIVDEDQVVYGINTGFGKLASTKLPTTAWPSCSATWCCRTAWARRCAARRRGAPHPGDQGGEPGARPFGHSPAIVGCAAGLGQCQCAAGDSGQGLGGRLRRPWRRWRTCRLRADWRRAGQGDGKVVPGRSHALCGPHTVCAGPQGRAGACSTARVSTALALAGLFGAENLFLPQAWWQAACRSKPSRARSNRSMPASTRPRPAGADRRAAPCAPAEAARSTHRIPTVAGCKTRTPSAACHR